jgi:membrane-bound serine protease (ClpP class)
MPVWLPFALITVGVAAILLELFVPAFGIIGIAGAGCLVAAVVLAYRNMGATMGTVILISTLVATPLLVFAGLKLFPRTFVGKWLILRDAQTGEYRASTEGKYADLAGREGMTLTDLRPSGTARIGERKLSVVTEGEYIGTGESVKVIAVEGSRVVVKRAGGTA